MREVGIRHPPLFPLAKPPAGGGHGDLLPLPQARTPVRGSQLRSRGVRRRATRQAGEESQLQELVEILNEMDSADWRAKLSVNMTHAQMEAHRRLRESIQRMGPRPADDELAGALQALCKQGVYSAEAPPARFGAAEVHIP